MKWLIPFLITSMGWTDDPDEEGLIEENPFVFIGVAIVGIVAVTILYAVGIEYQPGWFEGQNLLSTMGIIFLLVFVSAIAISTLTGKSDLVKWEAIFLFAAVFMILLGNNFDFSKFLQSFSSVIPSLRDIQVSKLLMFLLIIIGIAIAFAVGTGHKVSMGSVTLILFLIVAIGLINLFNADYFDNVGNYIQQHGFWYAFGKALSDFTGGLAEGKAGMAIGFGCLAVGLLLVFIPNFSTPIGIILIIIGCGILGASLWNWLWQPLFKTNPALGTATFGASIVGPGVILPFIARLMMRR